ncbi:MAG: preprotein translocase subunit SecG [Oceanicaulis sp.]
MTAVLLIIHLLVATALVAVILMQRSEGGALGIGGGPGGMMTGRGAANLLTRTTMILGALFIGNSILLAVISGVDASTRSVVDRAGETRTSDDLPFDFDDAPAEDEPFLQLPPEDAPADEVPSEDAPAEDAPSEDVPGESEPQLPN